MHDRITLRHQFTGMAFAAPYLMGFTVFLLAPILLSLYYSFCDYSFLQPPMWIGLDNYRALIHDPIFHQVLWNTFIYAACSVPLSLTTSLLLAVLLNLPIRGRAFFRTVIFLPSLVPAAAAAMIWLWVLNGQQGLLNVLLTHLINILNPALAFLTAGHVRFPAPPNWLAVAALAKPVFIVLSLYSIGNALIIFLAGLQDIPTELYESAQIDGASARARFFHITLPMLSPVIFFNLIMGVIASWQIFTLPYLTVSTTLNRSAYFYSEYLFDAAFTERRLGAASAMAWLQLLLILTLTLLLILTSRRWVHFR